MDSDPKATAIACAFKHELTSGLLAITIGMVECKSEGHIKYHLMHSNSVIEPFAGENAFNLAHFTAVFIQLACI